MLTDTKNSPFAKVSPLPWDAVDWTDGLWKEVFKSCTENTVPHLQKMFEDKDISHVLENFRICAGETTGDHDGTVFGDGDFYKWMEAAMYTAAKTNNTILMNQLDEYIDLIGRAQLEDGYISTKQIISEKNDNIFSRLGDIDEFEVYNFGHLFTSACLYYRITKKDKFLKIAIKAANYLKQMYVEAIKNNDVQTAVCPSHYMGLMEMYRTTQDKTYLDLAHLVITLRDSVENGTDDNQDRIPLKTHEKIVGHAVRANYLYAGVADLYAETGDSEYKSMLDKVWDNLINQKIYITGGCGALYNGTSPYGNFFIDQKVHQAYGYEYQLPNITAYNETCASVGSVLWAYRMFQTDPKAEYFDLIEKTMLNVNLAGISFDGERYFYENMLRRAKELSYELIWPLERTEYILSYCCPPNLARTLAQASEYAYTVSADTVWMGMYGANHAKIKLESGTELTLIQKTQYPYDGNITISFEDIKQSTPFNINIRIPHWVEKGYILNNDTKIELGSKDSSTYLTVSVENPESHVIEINFDMSPRYTIAHPLVEETNNQVALEMGPLVYCMETPDSTLDTLDDILLDLDAQYNITSLDIQDRTVTALEGEAFCIQRNNFHKDSLYQPLKYKGLDKTPVRFIPYYAWDNRGFGEMKIWMPIAYK